MGFITITDIEMMEEVEYGEGDWEVVEDPAKEFFDKVKNLSEQEALTLITNNENCAIMASSNAKNWFITWSWCGYWSIGQGANEF